MPEDALEVVIGLPIAMQKCKLNADIVVKATKATEYAKENWLNEPERFNAKREEILKESETFDFTEDFCYQVDILAHQAIADLEEIKARKAREAEASAAAARAAANAAAQQNATFHNQMMQQHHNATPTVCHTNGLGHTVCY